MTCVYVTSDWHINHYSIPKKFRTHFKDHDEHVQTLVDNYISCIGKRDICWFLGDICFDNEACEIIRSLPGTKHLVMGNHDTDRKCDIEQLVLTFDSVHSLRAYKQCWLSHAPIHPKELRGRFNVHGHMHEDKIDDMRYFNVCPEQTNYMPVKYQDIVREFQNRYIEYDKS
jgi:calcineurin-like phosphoesterase family protein